VAPKPPFVHTALWLKRVANGRADLQRIMREQHFDRNIAARRHARLTVRRTMLRPADGRAGAPGAGGPNVISSSLVSFLLASNSRELVVATHEVPAGVALTSNVRRKVILWLMLLIGSCTKSARTAIH
jgi:hypothetical protein